MSERATIRSALVWACERIERSDAEHLLLHAIARPRSWLFAHADEVLGADHQQTFAHLVKRRAQGEPVAYITGRRGFWSLELEVSPATLIPRPETELLVELALARISPTARVLDLGTGSGAIALAIAKERPRAQVIAVDASEDALAVARPNAQRLQIANVEFRHGDWYAPVCGEHFDVIVSNPPYIEIDDFHLREGDLRFEPNSALASGADGLEDLRVIVRDAGKHLNPGGWLLVEHGWKQGPAVRALFSAAGFQHIDTLQDLESRDRVTMGAVA